MLTLAIIGALVVWFILDARSFLGVVVLFTAITMTVIYWAVRIAFYLLAGALCLGALLWLLP